MLDYQSIIDDVRNSLYGTGPEASEALHLTAASAYAVACQEASARLRKCGELLKAGLRSEAIQQAEMEPNLLDVVATLDFSEREIWTQLASQHGIVAPAPLPLDIAAELNEAYALEQPLGALLARHRLLAIARSPLRHRITTLREIAETDSNNTVWLEDLQLYEQERLKQIQREAVEALNTGDTAAANSLADELQGTPWSESPPKGLLDRILVTREKLLTRQAKRELEQIDVDMNAAFSAFEIEQMRRLRDRWLANLPQSGFDQQAPICQRVAPALEWLEVHETKMRQSQEFGVALAALEEAIDDDQITESRLERLYRAATKHGNEVPVAIDRRVAARIEALQLAARRRFRLRLTAASLAGIIFASMIAFVIFWQMQKANIASHASSLATLIQDSKLEEARKYAERLTSDSPRIANSAEIQSLIVRLNGLMHQDGDRQKRLNGILEESGKSTGAVVDWASQSHAIKLLDEAEQLAKSDSEKADVKRLQLDLAEATRKLQQREDEEFTPLLSELSDQVRVLEDNRSEASQRRADINRLRTEARSLAKRGEHVTPALRDQIKQLVARLDAIEEETKGGQKREEAAATITAAVGNDTAFLKALEQYSKQFPESVRAADFRRATEEAVFWKGLARYTQLAEAWSTRNHTSVNAQSAKELIDTANVLLKDFGDYPDAAAFRMRLPYLESIVRRGTNMEDNLLSKLRANYGKPWIADLWTLQLKNGDRYYLKTKPKLDDAQWLRDAKFVVDFDLTEKRFLASKLRDIVGSGNSPQAIWAEGARKRIADLPDEKWESTIYALLQSIYANQDMDALPRLTLIRQTLEVGCQGSLPLEKAFKNHLSAVNDPGLDPFANWLDPNDEKARIARTKAEAILKDLPDLKLAGKQAAQDWQGLRNPVGNRYTWIGWICRDESDKWQCAHSQSDSRSGELVVVRKSPTDGKPQIDIVGQAQNGAFNVSSSSSDALLEGRPVFLAVPLAESNKSNSH